MSTIINIAREIFEIQASAILKLSSSLNQNFEGTVNAIIRSKGKVIVCGMGKSGIIGKKIAATLASTGTSSFFMHPGEAFHGDLGMVAKDDLVILISNSGETNEILKIIPYLKDNGNVIISITGNSNSNLAKNSNYVLSSYVEKEGCPLNLAPMASTTATLVLGDALAAALMKVRDFQPENFARFHPGGSLGKKLLVSVDSLMKKDNLPIVNSEASMKDIVHTLSEGRLGLTIIVDQGMLQGIITDGDIRRAMESDQENFFRLMAKDIMTKSPKTISPKAKLTEAENIMTQLKINSLLVMENNELCGVVQIYDIK